MMLICGKTGGVIKYTFWPGFGNRPSMEKRVKDAMAPESSFPGRPERVLLKREGMSGGVSKALLSSYFACMLRVLGVMTQIKGV